MCRTAAVALERAVMNDQDVLARIRLRDVDALGALYDRHASCLFSLALRILHAEPDAGSAAEEIVLRVFDDVWARSDQVDPDAASLRPWLTQRLRQRALERRTVAWPSVSYAADAPGTAVDTSEWPAPPWAALSSFERAAIDLAFFEGLSVAEIGERLNEDAPMVTRAIANGMRAMRALPTTAVRRKSTRPVAP